MKAAATATTMIRKTKNKSVMLSRNLEALGLALIALQLLLQAQSALCQVSDGDDTFQAYHQDIGRISGAPSNAPIAPQTIVRQVAAPVTAAPLPVVVAAPQPQPAILHQNRNSNRVAHSASPATRRNRITLAVRTHTPAAVALGSEPSSAPTASLASEAPAFASQLAAPQLGTVAPQPIGLGESSTGPVAPILAAGPALSSFQSSLGTSVSARHSALMAQVAAERQVASDWNGPQPSLGSPIEALSAPGPAVVAQPALPAPQFQPQQHRQQHQVAAAGSLPLAFVDRPEEPLVAPSFEQVLSRGCPPKGVFSYENKDFCDRYYMCTNGTFTEEACPNGLAYGQMGAVYQHCAYNWNVDCGAKKTAQPQASPGCPWQFGIFPITQAGRCSIDYFVCEWGVPETKRCTPEGLFYDDRIKGCQWADQLGCKSEALLNFKCPPEDEDNPYWPYPRYYHTKQDVIVCVNEQPRLVHCNEDQIVEPSSLACVDLYKKKKKKPF